MRRLCELQDAHVVDAQGRRLGCVFEFRSPGRAETEPVRDEREIRSLLCGRRGLLERLGWKKARPFLVPWSHVQRVDGGEIQVSGRYDDYERVEQ